MRAISQIIFIQSSTQLDRLIDKNPNVTVDWFFLDDNQLIKAKTLSNKTNLVWLWHLPFGVTEDDIQEHVKRMEQESNLLKV